MKLIQVTAIALALHTVNIWAADATSSPADKSNAELLSLGTALAKGDVATLEQKAINAAAGELQSVTKSYLEKLFPTVELSLGLGDPSKPTAGVLVVAPLSDPKDIKNTFFTQGSVYHFDFLVSQSSHRFINSKVNFCSDRFTYPITLLLFQ